MSRRASDPDLRIAAVAAKQLGVFSRTQAIGAGAGKGLIQHRLRTRRWIRVHQGVYRLPGIPKSWEQDVLALCLSRGPSAFASHSTAAALWGLPGFDPGAIEITVPRGKSVRGRGFTVHATRVLPARDTTFIGAIPITAPARTLIDLAATEPEELLEESLDDALSRELVTLPRLTKRLDDLSSCGREGAKVLRGLIRIRRKTGIPQSVLETRMLRLIRLAKLPLPRCQYRVTSGGRTVAVLDFAYPELELAIETDGYRFHSRRRDWERDAAKSNELLALGWRVLRFTWDQVNLHADEVLAGLREGLSRAGSAPAS